MFGYSITRPLHNQDYYYGIFDACEQFRCDIEGWHTESGPGVFEAVSVQCEKNGARANTIVAGITIRRGKGDGG